MPVTRAKPPAQARSRVTNGTTLFIVDDIDGRSPAARRFKDIIAGVSSDLGGHDHLSEVQRQLVRRFAVLSLQCELTEAALVAGDAVDVDLLSRLSGTMNRLASTLGLHRVAKDAKTLDLAEYLANRGGKP